MKMMVMMMFSPTVRRASVHGPALPYLNPDIAGDAATFYRTVLPIALIAYNALNSYRRPKIYRNDQSILAE